MNTKSFACRHSLAISALVVALGPTLPARANPGEGTAAETPRREQSAPVATPNRADQLRVATEDHEERGLKHFLGRSIHGANGKEVATVKDFVIDADSGEIAFVIAASGGFAGFGSELRLAPVNLILPAGKRDPFTTRVEQAEWSKLPAIDREDFEAGRIDVVAHQSAGTPDSRPAGSAAPQEDRRDFGPNFVRAGKLKDREVRSGGNEIGEIEDVLIDLDRRTATVLLEAEDDVAGTEGNFLVPFTHLQFTTGSTLLSTRLTRADFERARNAGRAVEADTEQLSPTGRDREPSRTSPTTERATAPRREAPAATAEREEQVVAPAIREPAREERSTTAREPAAATTAREPAAAQVDPVLESAARVVRQTWAAHPSLAKQDLRVTARDGRLVLEGSVQNVELWERAKDTAEANISRIEIENRIRIRDR